MSAKPFIFKSGTKKSWPVRPKGLKFGLGLIIINIHGSLEIALPVLEDQSKIKVPVAVKCNLVFEVATGGCGEDG